MDHQHEIERAAAALRAGELVAFPTETVYGLGADATNEQAVRRIFEVKGRPADHPVIVHLASAAALSEWAAEIPPAAIRLANRFWPGPLTLILPRAAHVLDVVTGGQPSVGLRVPDHPIAQALLVAFGGGIAAPSANRFGRISPTRVEHVHAEFGDAVSLVLDGGPSRVGVESSIVDLTGDQPVLLRPGHISSAEIAEVVGQPLGRPHAVTPRASGTLDSHYAPQTPVALVSGAELIHKSRELQHGGLRVAVLARIVSPPPDHAAPWIVAPVDAVGYAHELYARLRELDAAGCDRILVEVVPDSEDWLAVRDRLRRAGHSSEHRTDTTAH